MVHDPLSDAEIDRARLLIGQDFPSTVRHPFTTATTDAIYNFARACGSDNPLHCDPVYGSSTRWGSVIAPLMMAGAINGPLHADPPDPELRAKTEHLFENCHAFVSGGEWSFYRPVQPGDALFSIETEESVEPKTSRFGGRSVHAIKRIVKLNQRGEIVAINRVRRIISPRRDEKSAKLPNARPAYTEAEIARLEAALVAKRSRGAERRYFEGTKVGEALGDMTMGPLTTTDVIMFLAAGGFGFTRALPQVGKLAAQDRAENPTRYTKTPQGFFEVMQRMHWDGDFARSLGHPGPYDYGVMRESYLLRYLSEWCGDDGWVVRTQDEMRKFNYVGDVQSIRGEVTALRREDGRALADIAVTMHNQLDEETLRAQATVALPSRDTGLDVLPRVPDALQARASAAWTRHLSLAARPA